MEKYRKMDNVLYFPYISIPNTKWLYQTLLYWDKVGSIVPIEYDYNRFKLETHMQELVRLELVEIIRPDPYIYKFEDNFLTFVTRDNEEVDKRRDLFLNGKRFLIHRDKMAGSMFQNLEKMKLATLKEGSSSWYYVESQTASEFMVYLAKVIGANIGFRPSTDNENQVHLLRSILPSTNSTITDEIQSLRTVVIDRILPIPDHITSFEELLEFKSKHYRMLSRFRNHIELFLLDLQNTKSDIREAKMELFIQRSKQEVDDISELVKSNGWKVDFGTVVGVIRLVSVAIGTKGTSLLVDLINGTPNIYDAAMDIIPDPEKRQEILSKPMAYAFLTDKNLVVPNDPIEKQKLSSKAKELVKNLHKIWKRVL